MLKENRFDISLKGIPKVFFITFVIILFSPLTVIEILLSLKRIKTVELERPPIFILGHWRNGTTFLHELMIRNPDFGYMSLTEAVFPNLFLYFSKLIRKIMSLVLPDTRPQDDVTINEDFSSEHDFAIANLNSMSPYSGSYFPKNQEFYNKYVTFDGVTQKQKRRLKRDYSYIIRKLSAKNKNKQLILKSPIDTARIDLLIEIFPDAKFIHIYRNPYKVFFSTKRMHQKLIPIFQLQNGYPNLDEFIINTYRDIYYKYYCDFHLISKGNLVEIKYEELIENPIQEIEKAYQELSLSGFEKAKPKMERYLESVKNYSPNTYSINEKDKKKIYSNWNGIIDTMGYERPVIGD